MPSPAAEAARQTTILVTGASGYIASQLIPLLLERGLKVRCLVRNPAHLYSRSWFADVEVFSGDLTKPTSYLTALQGVSTAYYLVHGMSNGKNYIEQDLQAARDFSGSAFKAGVKHLIYLGGLADPQVKIARHMRSRIHTGESLRSGGVPVTEFRAGVIIGPGSISFEMIRFLVEQFPIILCPRWMSNLSQPIAIQNILDYLLAALELPNVESQVFEIGGSNVMTYADTMLEYARLRGLRRRVLIMPLNPVGLLAYFMAILTPVPGNITRPLVEGLCSDSIVQDDSALRVFPQIRPLGYSNAVRISLEKLDPRLVEPVWRQSVPPRSSLKHAGFCIQQRQIILPASPVSVLETIQKIQPPSENNKFNCAEKYDTRSGQEHVLLLHSLRKLPGQLWQEWRICKVETGTQLSQAMLFAPRGLPGFLWWVGSEPWIRLYQWSMFHKIVGTSRKMRERLASEAQRRKEE